MSCYKQLTDDNAELRLQLHQARQDIERLKEALAIKDDSAAALLNQARLKS